jgi:N-acetylneuraminate synthase
LSVYVIAEAGVNHNGSEELAFQLVDIAVNSGADAVKFQTFRANKIVNKKASKANYQLESTDINETQYEMLKKLELSYEAHIKLKDYCNKKGIDFLSTAFDEESLNFLDKELGIKTLKIPSGEITNAPLVLSHALTNSNLIVSTGMANLEEIRNVLGVIAYGYLNQNSKSPLSKDSFEKAFKSEIGKDILKQKVTILHCTSEYPAPLEQINLKAMNTIKNEFNLPIGYSDHTSDIYISIAAVAMGATIIEKHFTLDKSMPGPDHMSSLEPTQLKNMISAIRDVEKALGNSKKEPTFSEILNLKVIRKSLVAEIKIEKGDIFSSKNISAKRPGNGLSPFRYWDLIGKEASRSFDEGDLIEE